MINKERFMKPLWICLLMGLLFPLIAASQNNEEAAIKATMLAETQAFFQRNYEAWAQHWVKDETTFHAWNTRKGGYVVRRGWDTINENISQYIKDHPEPSHPEFYYRNLIFSITGDVAIVHYEEYASNKAGDAFTLAPGYKVLRKVDGQWKLAAVCSYWNYTYDISKDDIPE